MLSQVAPSPIEDAIEAEWMHRHQSEQADVEDEGKAFFASLDQLGAFIFKDFESGKNKTLF
jgi:hypothetical protein